MDSFRRLLGGILVSRLLKAAPGRRVHGPGEANLATNVPNLFATAPIRALQQHDLKRGVASLCIGGGEATAMAVERV